MEKRRKGASYKELYRTCVHILTYVNSSPFLPCTLRTIRTRIIAADWSGIQSVSLECASRSANRNYEEQEIYTNYVCTTYMKGNWKRKEGRKKGILLSRKERTNERVGDIKTDRVGRSGITKRGKNKSTKKGKTFPRSIACTLSVMRRSE